MKIAISTTLIPRENIFWIEEWINYHFLLGFDAIYLYDNTGSERYDVDCDSRYVVSLSGVNYKKHDIGEMTRHLSENDLQSILKAIVDKYEGRVSIIPWQPRDETGRQFFGQTLAFQHFLENFGHAFEWALLTDTDEFLVNSDFRRIIADYDEQGFNEVRVHPRLFTDRVHGATPIVPTLSIITEVINYPDNNPKQFVKCKDVIRPNVHHGGVWETKYNPVFSSPLEFHHYRMGAWCPGGESIFNDSLVSMIPRLHLEDNVYIPLPVLDEQELWS